ncbi:unnamed protein product [Arabidopsis arenosa]|uniref:Uncharacterized protein n=1 Tax=Arabidopsis arenosa TaxID=38785 RepID=A0A8S2A8J4_ARAAE|nr:unnamed protein product [Arabidopsis arenosa]
MGMEVCCTLDMIEKQQALELKKAGLTAYNHNLDTSREYYPNVRSLLEVMTNALKLLSMFVKLESTFVQAEEDTVGLLHTLATLPSHPESVPINALLAVKGTPLEDQKPVEIWEMIWNRTYCNAKSNEKLLTTPNNDFDADQLMFKTLGLIPKPPSFSEDDSESENCEKVASASH